MEAQKLKADLEKAQKLNKDRETELAAKDIQIKNLEAELKRKIRDLDLQKQKVTELTEIMNRQVRDKSRPAEHRQGMTNMCHLERYLLSFRRYIC
jgi:hypothetical protein